jgi:hypothetical protein
MKSALLATILGIIGGVAILSAVTAEEKPPVIKVQPAKSFPDYGEPVVPQIEETPPQERPAPKPSDRYLFAQTKTEKTALRHHGHVVRARPNFFEKLFAGFIKLQKRPAAQSVHKRSRTTSRVAD